MKLFEDKEPGDSCSLLEIRDVVKSFGGIKALDHCTFRVQPGKITGLIGPNGAGKTSLFDLITGFLKVTSGSIWFSGQRIDGLGGEADLSIDREGRLDSSSATIRRASTR